MAAFQGYNPYGGYGVPVQMNQPMYQQNNHQMYMNSQQAQMQQIATQNQQMQQQIPVTVRFVTKYNEADAAQIAFDNTINLFINLASGEIYMKRFDMNSGQAPIVTYRQERPKATHDEPEQTGSKGQKTRRKRLPR